MWDALPKRIEKLLAHFDSPQLWKTNDFCCYRASPIMFCIMCVQRQSDCAYRLFIYLFNLSGALFGSDPMKSRFTPNCIWKTENAIATVYTTNTCRVRLIQFIVVIMYAEYVKWHISTRLLMAVPFWISMKSTIIIEKVSKSDFYKQKSLPSTT